MYSPDTSRVIIKIDYKVGVYLPGFDLRVIKAVPTRNCERNEGGGSRLTLEAQCNERVKKKEVF